MKAKTKLALKNYLTFPSNPAGIRSLEGLKKKCRKLLLAPAALLSSDGNPRREKAAAAPNLPRRRGAFNTWRRRGRVPRRARISTRRQRPDLPSWGGHVRGISAPRVKTGLRYVVNGSGHGG